ncbi:hypothetical protein [Aerosakkonema funiforme]|uniref:hypothetical protein n=1 Tax=Aerosakkonema funiforme TaxID=1246630 RepID=UPI0035BAE1BD
MENFTELLATQNSKLAEILWLNLYQLNAVLSCAKSDYPEDPGILICERILENVKELLKTKPQGWQTATQTVIVDNHQETQIYSALKELKLKKLLEELSGDRSLISELGNNLPIQGNTDEQLWSEIQLLLLRIPDNLANFWQKRALEIAQQVGAKEDNRSIIKLPYIREEPIYSGLVGTIQAKGLRFSQQVNIDTQVTSQSQKEDLDLLSRTVSTYLRLIELDPFLHHALKSVYRFGVMPLTDENQRSKYINTLIDYFRRVERAETSTDLILSLKARLNLDEAIHSLVYQPPAHQASWWSKLQQEARRTLIKFTERVRQAGHDVHIRPLSGLYADVFKFSKDDLGLDSGGNPGEVLTCLRVYARINHESFPGRVLYRSSQ